MNKAPRTFIASLALSLQRGLLGRILPEIRAIGIGHQDKMIDIYCIVDDEPSTLLIDEVDCAATEVISDFLPGFGINTHIERVDSPKRRYYSQGPKIIKWVYARYEEN